MTPEERELLNKVAAMTEDNNKMLHSIRRSMRWASILRAIYWVVIIGSAVGAFWLVQPYLNTLTGGATSDFSNIKNVINTYRAQTK